MDPFLTTSERKKIKFQAGLLQVPSRALTLLDPLVIVALSGQGVQLGALRPTLKVFSLVPNWIQ